MTTAEALSETDALIRFFQPLSLNGPGDDTTTIRVLRETQRQIGALAATARVLDLGCGTGRQTVVLARALPCPVSAIDASAAMIEATQHRLIESGVTGSVHADVGDMAHPAVPPGSVDLIWSEGAPYVLGFQRALELWRPLLKPTGAVVVSECTWLADDPPPAVADFWQEHYPGMGGIESNLAAARAAGYQKLFAIPLPPKGWHAYYQAVENRIAELRAAGEEAGMMARVIANLEREMAIFAQAAMSYNYVFYGFAPAEA